MHGKKIINNSIISFIYKIIMILLGFIIRKIFIMYLGEEILGLNSLYTNLLDLLNLADLGIGVAVQFQMYEHLVKKNYDKLSKILSAAKRIYNKIGFLIITGGLIITIFIPYLIKSTTYPIYYVRIAFLINVIGIALGYFFVHKKLFLLSNEKIGIVNIIDLIAKLLTVVISIITTIIFKNYLLYLAINALYGLLSNLIVNYFFNKHYKNINSNLVNIEKEQKELTSNLKNVIPIKVSNYIYNSTDNVIISKALGLATVALYTNYMTIINGVMQIEYLIGNVIMPSLGKIFKEEKNMKKIYRYFNVYQYFQFLFTCVCVVALAHLCNNLISIWLGEKFIIGCFCFILLIVDFFIHSMYQPAYVVYGSAGLFEKDKIATIIGAVMNIVLSIVLVIVIGLPGVIIGTLVSDIFIWIIRSYQVVKQFFKQKYIEYILNAIKYIFIVIISFLITYIPCKYISINNLLLNLIIKGFICVIISSFISIIFTYKSDEFLYCKEYLLKYKRR